MSLQDLLDITADEPPGSGEGPLSAQLTIRETKASRTSGGTPDTALFAPARPVPNNDRLSLTTSTAAPLSLPGPTSAAMGGVVTLLSSSPAADAAEHLSEAEKGGTLQRSRGEDICDVTVLQRTPAFASTVLGERFADCSWMRQAAALAHLTGSTAGGANSSVRFLTVLCDKFPSKTSSSGSKFAAIRLWDTQGLSPGVTTAKSVHSTVPALLVDQAFEQHYVRLSVGDALLIVRPALMPPRAGTSSSPASSEAMLRLSDASSMFIVGRGDVQKCAAVGEPCNTMCNRRISRFCVFHLRQAAAASKSPQKPTTAARAKSAAPSQEWKNSPSGGEQPKRSSVLGGAAPLFTGNIILTRGKRGGAVPLPRLGVGDGGLLAVGQPPAGAAGSTHLPPRGTFTPDPVPLVGTSRIEPTFVPTETPGAGGSDRGQRVIQAAIRHQASAEQHRLLAAASRPTMPPPETMQPAAAVATPRSKRPRAPERGDNHDALPRPATATALATRPALVPVGSSVVDRSFFGGRFTPSVASGGPSPLERLKQIAASAQKCTSQNASAVATERQRELEQRLAALDAKDAVFEALDQVREEETVAVWCAVCRRWTSAKPTPCVAAGHTLSRQKTVKKFFRCGGCGTVDHCIGEDVFPTHDCPRCHKREWSASSAAFRPVLRERDQAGDVVPT